MIVAQLTTDNREPFRQYDNPTPWFGSAPEALLEGFADLNEIEIHVVTCTQQPMSSPEKLAKNIWFHSLHVPKAGWLRTGYQGCIRAVRRKLQDLRPEIVHGQGTERECAMSAVFSGFPNVLTIHGNMRSIARVTRAKPLSFYWLAARLEAFALRRTAGVVCNSAHTEQLVEPLTPRTWKIPNPVRGSFFLPLPSRRRAVEIPVLLNIGTVLPNKRQLEVLRMAERLWEEGARFQLYFVGALDTRSAYGAEFKARLERHEVAGRARYLGLMSENELITCLDASDGLVHAPLEEAFGLVVAEALARNLKLFATRVGGIIDIAAGVEETELFDRDDWEGMGNAISRWIQLGALRPVLAADAMRARYQPRTIAQRHLEIYREVLSTLR